MIYLGEPVEVPEYVLIFLLSYLFCSVTRGIFKDR